MMITPWGTPQYTKELIPGVFLVSTAGHGGMVLSEERVGEIKALFPNYKPCENFKYLEEDLDATLVILAWPDEFNEQDCYFAYCTAKSLENSYNQGLSRNGVNYWDTEEGKKVVEKYRSFLKNNEGEWERGGMASCEEGWEVFFRNIATKERRTVIFPRYPDKMFHTTAELNEIEGKKEQQTF